MRTNTTEERVVSNGKQVSKKIFDNGVERKPKKVRKTKKAKK